MISRQIVIELKEGLKPEPVAMIVQLASQYSSTVYLESEGKKINAKSIMGMMSLGLPRGEALTVVVEGVDEEVAAARLEAYLTKGIS